MLQHVHERVSQARYVSNVIIATDDERILAAARRFGAEVRMTRSDHFSGTDRVAEVASAESAELVVNVQGDEPLIDPAAIDAAILPLLEEPAIPMATLKKRIEHPRELDDPNVVKVVTDRFENAIYFSRSTIPYLRHEEKDDKAREQEEKDEEKDDKAKGKRQKAKGKREEAADAAVHFKHVGLYVYRRGFLLRYSEMPVGPLEKAERLEQLRALENGYSIRVVETEYESLGVDTPEDLERVRELFEISLAAGARKNG